MKKIPTAVLFFGLLVILLTVVLWPYVFTSSSTKNDSTLEPVSVDEEMSETVELISVTTPKSGAVVTQPVVVSGQALGYWFFEGSFPVELVDLEGNLLGQGVATAQSDWMTDEFVPFSGVITADLEEDIRFKPGVVVFKKANPSGLEENNAVVSVQVIFQ